MTSRRSQSSQPNGSASPKRRGRPRGSVSLTREIEEKIVSYIRAGAFAHVAARAAGISPRTFFDWMSRGRGEHPTRPSTPKLRLFARRVDRAHAEARLAAEVRMHRENPKYWLSHAARSRPEEEGWTELKEKDAVPFEETLEGRIRAIDEHAAEVELHQQSCSDPRCGSPDLHRRYLNEY